MVCVILRDGNSVTDTRQPSIETGSGSVGGLLNMAPKIIQHKNPTDTNNAAMAPREFVQGNNTPHKKNPNNGEPNRLEAILISW